MSHIGHRSYCTIRNGSMNPSKSKRELFVATICQLLRGSSHGTCGM